MTLARQQAVSYFVSMGWTPAQAAGLVANLEAESRLNPAAVGDGGRAYGIAQWHPDRQVNFAAAIGRDIRGSSLEDQLAFVHAELNSTEKSAGDALRACTSPGEAGAVVSKRYERPADTEGEAAKRATLAESIFRELVTEEQPAAPIEDRSRPHVPEKPMPVFAALLPSLLQLIPGLISIFGKSERAQQNAKAAQLVADAVVAAVPGAPNLQAAVETMQANAEVQKAAAKAVMENPMVVALVEVGGGIVEARKQAQMAAESPSGWWRSLLTPAFIISLILLAGCGFVVYHVVGNSVWRAEDRSQVLMLAVAVVSGVMGFYLGSSLGSQRKDDALISGR